MVFLGKWEATLDRRTETRATRIAIAMVVLGCSRLGISHKFGAARWSNDGYGYDWLCRLSYLICYDILCVCVPLCVTGCVHMSLSSQKMQEWDGGVFDLQILVTRF